MSVLLNVVFGGSSKEGEGRGEARKILEIVKELRLRNRVVITDVANNKVVDGYGTPSSYLRVRGPREILEVIVPVLQKELAETVEAIIGPELVICACGYLSFRDSREIIKKAKEVIIKETDIRTADNARDLTVPDDGWSEDISLYCPDSDEEAAEKILLALQDEFHQPVLVKTTVNL